MGCMIEGDSELYLCSERADKNSIRRMPDAAAGFSLCSWRNPNQIALFASMQQSPLFSLFHLGKLVYKLFLVP